MIFTYELAAVLSAFTSALWLTTALDCGNRWAWIAFAAFAAQAVILLAVIVAR